VGLFNGESGGEGLGRTLVSIDSFLEEVEHALDAGVRLVVAYWKKMGISGFFYGRDPTAS